MNKEYLLYAILIGTVLFLGIGLVLASLTHESCPVAEVYMVGNIQEDDLFIPASSIGKVDLKR